ncbi:MAG: hypothetical protein LBQ39_07290 [Tannerellaceae bacterium]|nr:hypothetical protein [Tannerellaceae bacterium]
MPNFFHIDIYHIFKHEPSLIEKSVDGDGNPVEKYTLNLKEMELSTFCKVHIIRFEDDTYNLVFTGDINEIKDDLKEFVQYCAVQFGPDFMRKEGITEGDYRDMMLGVFSRIWYNHLCIENSHFTISLTLYHISNNRTNV